MGKIFLILWAVGYGFSSTPVIQRFDSFAQCEAMKRYVTDAHISYRDMKCVKMNDDGSIQEQR